MPASRLKNDIVGALRPFLPEIAYFRVVSVDDVCGERFHSTPAHELVHVQKGHARIQFRDRSFQVKAGDTFVVPQGVEHRDIRLSEGAYRTVYIFFHWPAGDSLIRGTDVRKFLTIPEAARGFLHHLVTEFEREYLGQGHPAIERLNFMLFEVLLALVRHSLRPGLGLSHAAGLAAGQRRRDLALQARSYLEAHYAEPVGLEEVARHLGVSPFHLSRSFSGELGTSLTDVLTMIRIEQARVLLGGNELSVKEVAARTGYSCGNYFAKVFRRVCGFSPNEYRVLTRRAGKRARQRRPPQ